MRKFKVTLISKWGTEPTETSFEIKADWYQRAYSNQQVADVYDFLMDEEATVKCYRWGWWPLYHYETIIKPRMFASFHDVTSVQEVV